MQRGERLPRAPLPRAARRGVRPVREPVPGGGRSGANRRAREEHGCLSCTEVPGWTSALFNSAGLLEALSKSIFNPVYQPVLAALCTASPGLPCSGPSCFEMKEPWTSTAGCPGRKQLEMLPDQTLTSFGQIPPGKSGLEQAKKQATSRRCSAQYSAVNSGYLLSSYCRSIGIGL